MREFLQLAPLVAIVACAAAIDLRARRIPNWLTFPLIATGLVHAWLTGSTITPAQSFAGLLVGVGLTFFLFALGPIGAGDVKLLAGIGAWIGPLAVVQVFAATSIAGLFVVAWQAIGAKEVSSLVRGSAVIMLNAARGDWQPPPEPKTQRNKRLPYAVPVLIGMLGVLLAKFWRWL
jgi:prepilin peptidase CpaA